MKDLKLKFKKNMSKTSNWLRKPQNSVILISMIGIILLFTVGLPILSIYLISLENLFSLINLFLVSIFSCILALIQLRRYLVDGWNKNKFELEGLGKSSTDSARYFFAIIKNKTNEVALNCRGNLKIEGHHSADTVWADPSHPREIDIPLREQLDLFCIIGDTILIPSGTIGRYSEYQILRQITEFKAAKLENSWQEGAHVTRLNYNDLSSKPLDILITSRNAKPMEIKLKTIQDLVLTLDKSGFVTTEDLESKGLLT